MADSIRERIIIAFKALMSTITIANGYSTDLGVNVFRGISRPLEHGELPGLIINEGKETTEDTTAIGFDQHRLSVDIAARIKYSDGDDWFKICNTMLADVIKAIGTNQTLSGLVLWTDLISNQAGIDDGDKQIAGTDIAIIINYRTQHLDPFN